MDVASPGRLDSPLNGLDIKERYEKALSGVGASKDFSNFFADIQQCEHDMNTRVQRLHQSLTRAQLYETKDPGLLYKSIQDLIKTFGQWRSSIDGFAKKGRELPPLHFDSQKVDKSGHVRALCSLETKEIYLNGQDYFHLFVGETPCRVKSQVNLKEGDELTITDTSEPNRLKVRNDRGEEGYVPALVCILPSPDKNAVGAVERLRLQLLASWTNSVKKARQMVLEWLLYAANNFSKEELRLFLPVSPNQLTRVSRRLSRLGDLAKVPHHKIDLPKIHSVLLSLENELATGGLSMDDNKLVPYLASLDKSVLTFQMLQRQYVLFKRDFELTHRGIKIVDRWEDLRPVSKGRSFKYFEMKMTLEEVETIEEIVSATAGTNGTYSVTSGGATNETVSADQITRASREVNRTFVIQGVIDPTTDQIISLQDAIQMGVVDQEKGLYKNPNSGSFVSIPEAMNCGKIKVEFSSTKSVTEESSAVGLITINTVVDDRPYVIDQVIDGNTGEKISEVEAVKRGILDTENGHFTIGHTEQVIDIHGAIQTGWILVHYTSDAGQPKTVTKTYAVATVVDQRQRKKISFQDAVRRGLIEKETGNYINNKTGEKIYVGEAIRRGFLKAKLVHDTVGLDVDAENHMIVEKVDYIKKNVLTPVGVIKAFQKAGKLGIKSAAGYSASKSATNKEASRQVAASLGSRPANENLSTRSAVGNMGTRPTANNTDSMPTARNLGTRSANGNLSTWPVAGNMGTRPTASATATMPTAVNLGTRPDNGDLSTMPAAGNTGTRPTARNTGTKPVAGNMGTRPANGNLSAMQAAGNVVTRPMSSNRGSRPPSWNLGTRPVTGKLPTMSAKESQV